MARIDKIEEKLDCAIINQNKANENIVKILTILEAKSNDESRLKVLEQFKSYQVGAVKFLGILGLLAGIVTAGVSLKPKAMADDRNLLVKTEVKSK